MLVVSTNSTLHTLIRKAVDLATARHVIVCQPRKQEKFEEVLEDGEAAFLIVDLTACMHLSADEIADTLYAWRMLNPSGKPIILYPSGAASAATGAYLFKIASVAGVKLAYPMVDVLTTEFWLDLILANPFTALVEELRKDFAGQCDTAGLEFPNKSLIHTVLSYAPYDASFTKTVASIRLSGAKQLNVNRHWLWQKLRDAKQVPPTYLCTAFRVAAMLKMRQQTDWKASTIAQYLGYPDARTMMLRQKTRTGFRQRELMQVPYAVWLRGAGVLCLPQYPSDAELPPVQELFAPVVEPYLTG